jgi:hypothetical protein
MMRSAGAKERRRLIQMLSCWIGSALISTQCAIRRVSSPGSTNAGSVVEKSVTRRVGPWTLSVAVEPSGRAGKRTTVRNRPVMLSPRL